MHTRLIQIITTDVSELFRLNKEELFELKLEYGLKYIDDRYPATEFWREPNDIAQALKASPVFWNWWLDLWAQRDRHLMNRCERRRCIDPNGENEYGVNYTFLLNGYIGAARMTETRVLGLDDLWDFYQDYHYWRKVSFYPNEVMIGQCLADSNVKVLSTINQ